jgi:hypothetical protein
MAGKAIVFFATPYLSKTLMFAFDWYAREAILGGAIEGSTDQFIIICEREKTLAKVRCLYIYSFSGGGFGFGKTLTGSAYLKNTADTREFYAIQSIPAGKLQLCAEISDINELMAKGLQIFSTHKTYDQLMAEDFLGEFYLQTPAKEWLRHLLQNGFVWENKNRQINPNAVLL